MPKYQRDTDWLPYVISAVLFVGAIIAVMIGMAEGCQKTQASRETLRTLGYTDIQLTGVSYFACGKGDSSCVGFTAKAPYTNIPIKGAVGCGYWFKGCTVRLTP